MMLMPVLEGNTFKQAKSGFTLVELLVYIVILGIIVIIAGRAFSDSTKMRVQIQNALEVNQDAETVSSLLKDDLGQMGAKVYEKDSGKIEQVANVFMAADDSSSFFHKRGDSWDSIAFRKIRYNTKGEYQAVEEITWSVRAKDSTLIRSCKSIAVNTGATASEDCKANDATSVTITNHVKKFFVTPAKPRTLVADNSKVLFPAPSAAGKFRFVPRFDGNKIVRAEAIPAEGAATVALSQFVTNFNMETESVESNHKRNEFYVAESNANSGSWSTLCKKFTFEEKMEYEIEFKLPFNVVADDRSQLFVPGRDHMSVGLRYTDGTKIDGLDDFMFFPPTGDKANAITRRIRFTPKSTYKDACLVFTFAMFSPMAASGSISVSNLVIQKVMESNYSFDHNYEPLKADKRNIRAFNLDMEIEKSDKTGKVNIVIPTPSNGVTAE